MVRSAGKDDLPSVAALYHRVWHETHGPYMPYTEREARGESFFLDRLANVMPNVILGEAEGKIIGFAAWKGSLLAQFFLDVAVRGSGFAPRLMKAAEQGLYDDGIREAELHCLVGNERARRFYERSGWQVRGIIAELVRGDTDGEERSFWMMCKSLAPLKLSKQFPRKYRH
ncbi:N-acetyltransferase family protein [Methylobacterium sp. D54C]